MKKTTTFTTVLALCMLATIFVQAQSSEKVSGKQAALSIGNARPSTARTIVPNSTQSLWDIQFDYDFGAAVPTGSAAGCVYTGTEFWVGKWNGDTMFTFSPAGALTSSFVIAGVGAAGTGVRAMTYDGTYIYAGVNTTGIAKIDPTNKTLAGTITSMAPVGVRGLAYDSTADAGAGGFWVSNFGSDFYLISMTGALLDSIDATEHGLTGVYNIAIDNYTTGAPSIWAFDQSNTQAANIVKIDVTTHQPAGVMHNTKLDLTNGAGGLAGGLSITWRYDPNHYTLMGTQQNSNRLFGYELADYIPPAVDASVDSLIFNPPYTLIPSFEIVPYDFRVVTHNQGTDPLADLESILYVNDGTSNVYSPTSQHDLNVAPSATVSASFGTFTPVAGNNYTAVAKSNTGAQTDQVLYNDSTVIGFGVSDTVYARDNGNPTGSLGIGDSLGGSLGQTFTLATSCYITSVNFLLNGPTPGDTVSVDIYNFTTMPTTIRASTPKYTFTPADSNGVALTLMPSGGPVYCPAGTYLVAVKEDSFNVTLANTSFNYRARSGWVTFTGVPWTPLELLGAGQFAKTFVLRLDVLDTMTVGIAQVAKEKFTIYPNPASSQLHISSQSKNYKVELFDMVGKLVESAEGISSGDYIMNVSSLSVGIYNARITSGNESSSLKVSIQR